ncbi:MAG: insulinase family protein [Proteobacteria bacterium]|nr:insulinase family protein [Pseudomonadota bacterium]
MIKKLFLVVILLSWAKSLCASPLLPAETFTLKNGVQFILMQNKRAPIVSYSTWYKVGSADEIPKKTGLAHYLEHLMESGLPEVQMGQFLEDFQASGTHSNASTAQDYTFYFKMVMTDHLELLMQYEAGRMRGVAFNKDKFETEKNVILEERLMRTENEPIELSNEKFNRQFFTVHPYQNPIIGWENDIRNLTLEDIKAFHAKWYHPNNAFVIVSGDFEPAQVKAWAEKYYGSIPSGPKVIRSRSEEPLDQSKLPPVILEHPRATEFSYSQIYHLPELKQKKYTDLLALFLLSEFLDGDFEGSLYEILVHKKKLATSFNSQCPFYSYLDPWSFVIYVSASSESRMQEIETTINETLAHIAKVGLTPEDLKRARKYLYNSIIVSLDDIFQKAVFLGEALSSNLTLEQINALPSDLEKITSADIQRVIATYLTKDKAAINILKKPSSPLSQEKEK